MPEPVWKEIFADALPDPRYDAANPFQKRVHDNILTLFSPGWTPATATPKNLALASIFAVIAQAQSDFDAFAAKTLADNTNAVGQVRQAQDAFAAAMAATDVYLYQPVAGLVPTGYVRVRDADLPAFGIKDDVTLVDDDTGFYSALYVKGAPRAPGTKYILANRGTDGDRDYWASALQDIGLPARQYQQAVAAAKAVTKVIDDTHGTVIYAGHSLGGGLATLQALTIRRPGYVFQTAGVSPLTLEANGAEEVPPAKWVTAFDYHGDWLDDLQRGQGGVLLRPPIGWPVILPRIVMPKGAADDNSNDWHLMNFVVPAMLQMLKAGAWPHR